MWTVVSVLPPHPKYLRAECEDELGSAGHGDECQNPIDR